MIPIAVARPFPPDGCIDAVEIDVSGVLRVFGWDRAGADRLAGRLAVVVNGIVRSAAQLYWHIRPDVPSATTTPTGFFLELNVAGERIDDVEIRLDGRPVFTRGEIGLTCLVPDYVGLRDETTVLQREHIYGSGPPSPGASHEIVAFAMQLTGPVLDFGCGIGALMRPLRQAGTEVYGIELDREPIRAGLPDDLRPFVTLYDGRLPSPFAARQFESVVCSEVLEHIPHVEPAIAELARLCRSRCLITVPDIGMVPSLHRHNVVPWHLLEGTHVNFFTHASLGALLRKYFGTVRFARTGEHRVNDTRCWVSLVAFCSDPA